MEGSKFPGPLTSQPLTPEERRDAILGLKNILDTLAEELPRGVILSWDTMQDPSNYVRGGHAAAGSVRVCRALGNSCVQYCDEWLKASAPPPKTWFDGLSPGAKKWLGPFFGRSG